MSKSLREMIGEIKAEFDKGEKMDKARIEELFETADSTAARDAAMYARAKTKADAIGDKRPEDIDRIAAENDELKLKLDDAEKRAKKAETDKAKVEKELGEKLSKKSGDIQRLIRDEAILKELTATNVKPEFLKAAAAMLRDRVEVDEDAMAAFGLGKDKDGKDARKPLADFVKEWAGTDEGKHFVLAGQSSGGGAGGGAGKGAGAGVAGNPWKKESWNMTRQLDLIRTDKAAAIRTAAEAGVEIKLGE